MPDLSVVIPSRNEPWLLKTIESIRSEIRGDTEIIAVIDGEEAEPKLPEKWPDGPVVRVIRNEKSIGQRQSINLAVSESHAKYIVKTDAHSMFDEGFDVKLTQDCEYDWTVIPRMYNLHGWDLICPKCQIRFYNRGEHRECPTCGRVEWQTEVVWQPNFKKKTDWMWFRSPECTDRPMRVQYWGGKAAICESCKGRHDEIPDNGHCDYCGALTFRKEREFDVECKAHKEWTKRQGDIADVMNGQGACWFMHRERFLELGGMDERHGSWGQMGVEVALKTWLSGGRHVVNRKTWFAHLFRCGEGASFPYKMHGKDQEKARQYSIDLWSNNKWPGQKRPLSWLIEHFWPVPTWEKPTGLANKAPSIARDGQTAPDATNGTPNTDLTVLYYTDNSLLAKFADAVLQQVRKAAGGLPVVEQHQPPDWVRGHDSIYRNILAGLEQVTTPYVALAEHDVLYPKGHFSHRPAYDFEYNTNRWCLHADRGVYSYRTGLAFSQLFAKTDALRAYLVEQLKHLRTFEEYRKCFEPGSGENLGGSDFAKFESMTPAVDISGHGFNLTGPKGARSKVRTMLKPWGSAMKTIERFCIPVPAKPEQPQQVSADGMRTVPDISILIPARNEVYLEATVRDLLKNLRLDFEIIIGLDGPDQMVGLFGDERVRVIRSDTRIGMRPMINKLAREARGKYLMRMDAHCMVAEGIDKALVEVCEREGHVTVVAQRYELNPRRWERRDKTDIPYRRLSHVTEDGKGLRSLPWPEFGVGREKIEVDETMACSGSSWTCLRSTFADWWGGFDERHGTFGQEGCEIACMTWLSGGRFLVHKGTWYAHWNRGKSTYALGKHTKDKSIEHSKWLWCGNNWKYARYGFEWLIEKFKPPGWPTPEPVKPMRPKKHRYVIGNHNRMSVEELWTARQSISDLGKWHRLTIFWKSYDEFVCSVLAGKPQMDGQYRQYLLGHVNRHPGQAPTARDIRKVDKSIKDSMDLIASVKKVGLKAPLEFYAEDNRMILWKGYRRLVIAHVLGIHRVVGRCYGDRQMAGTLSPQLNLTRLQNPPVTVLHDLATEQFRKWANGATDKYWVHNYTRYYDIHLHAIRKRAKRILELGILRGASLALWRDYFPRAEIIGVDSDAERWKKYAADLPKTTILVGDETDSKFMADIAKHGPFDLIVDDASHDPALQRQAFEWLWPAVKQYGYYVIEDTFRSYDGQEQEHGVCLPAGFESRIYQERDVLSIHHYYNIVFIQKA